MKVKMKNQIEITEEDIFKFALNPENLPKEKYEYLNSNKDRFKKEIDYCTSLLTMDNTAEINSIAGEIMEKIKSFKIIELYPQLIKTKEENGVKLAAASVLNEKPRNSFSFDDPDSKYLIRIVKTESQHLLYFFSDDNPNHNLRITIYPSQTEYHISDLSKPIEILDEHFIEKITIQ